MTNLNQLLSRIIQIQNQTINKINDLSVSYQLPSTIVTANENGKLSNQLLDLDFLYKNLNQTRNNIPLTFTAQQTDSYVFFRRVGGIQLSGLQIKYNTDQDWQYIDSTQTHYPIAAGHSIQVRNLNNTLSLNTEKHLIILFKADTKIRASGNIMSLLNFSDKCHQYCFYNLFANQKSLLQAPQMPCLNLASNCYHNMYQGTGLIQMPNLPAAELASYCYFYMFYKCEDLKCVKPLKASIVQEGSYQQMFSHSGITAAPQICASVFRKMACHRMFYRCKSLIMGPKYLNANMLDQSALNGMFSECDNLEVCFSYLPAKIIPKNAYYCLFYKCFKLNGNFLIQAEDIRQSGLAYMFYQCRSLTNTPIFSSTNKKLGNYCYNAAFMGCAALTATPNILGEINSGSEACFYRTFKDCTSLSLTFDKLQTNVTPSYCYQQMYAGCTSLQKSPYIILNSLNTDCCSNMFAGCSSLTNISLNTNEWRFSDNQCFNDWCKDVSTSGTFNYTSNVPIEYSTSRIPENWVINQIVS